MAVFQVFALAALADTALTCDIARKSQISNLKSQISNLKSQISNLKSQISNLKSQISNLKPQASNAWSLE
jgi:phage shock protein A